MIYQPNKVICNKNTFALTFGKSYDVIKHSITQDTYLILCDNGYKYWVSTDVFKTLVDIRDEKLNLLDV